MIGKILDHFSSVTSLNQTTFIASQAHLLILLLCYLAIYLLFNATLLHAFRMRSSLFAGKAFFGVHFLPNFTFWIPYNDVSE